MALHALDDVDDALEVSRDLLFPVEVRTWLKLAVVAFFVGGATNLPSGQFDTGAPADRMPVEEFGGVPDPEFGRVFVALVVVALLVWTVFAVLGAIMEFVLVESLRTREVAVRRHWRRRWRQGLRLFAFRVAIGLPFLALFAGWAGLLVYAMLTGSEPLLPVGILVLGVPVLLVAGVLYALVSGFTAVFVVPIMVREDSGVLDGWRRLWPSIRAEWTQYLAFAVVGFVLTVAAGLAASLALGVGAVLLAIPLGVVAGATYLTISVSSTAGLVVVGVLVAIFVAALVLLWALIQVPVVTYLRYYALLVLGDVEPAFDIIPEQREAARE